ncbi:MAG: glycosyltransferase family 2 protein, partial [Chitinivibrionales bacterium]
FDVVDEESNTVPYEKLSPSIKEILDSHKGEPPQGENAWIEIATTKGYTNLTSATGVRTEIAKKFPFPREKVSEDSHTWMRYSAGGDKFVFTDECPTHYRIPQNTAGSSSRTREGGKSGFYKTKARVDTEGFMEAAELALKKGDIKSDKKDELSVKFLIKLGDTLAQEDEIELAREQFKKADEISPDITAKVLEETGFAGQAWTKA